MSKKQIGLLVSALVIMCAFVVVGGGVVYFMLGRPTGDAGPVVAETGSSSPPEQAAPSGNPTQDASETEAVPPSVSGSEDTPQPITNSGGATQTIAYGQSAKGTISVIGDRHSYTFEGQAGEQVTVFLKGGGFWLYLVGPDEKGWDCLAPSRQCQIDNVKLPVTGQYTVVVDGYFDNVGDYTLSLVQTND